MKKCPVCHQFFNQRMLLKNQLSKKPSKLFSEHLTHGKGVIQCPHCSAWLRKKISVWFIPALIPVLISGILYPINHQYAFLFIISMIFFMIFYANLPYVPYDKWHSYSFTRKKNTASNNRSTLKYHDKIPKSNRSWEFIL